MKWRKVWKDDPASTFCALCPTTKAIAYFLVVNANDDGGIGPWGDDWKANVCKAVGIPTRQRKLWFRCLDELLADGWLCERNGAVAIRNFARFQGARNAPKRSRNAPSCAESVTNGILVGAKPPKSLDRNLQEEKRIEEKRVNTPTGALGGADEHEKVYRNLIRAYARRIESRTQVPWAAGPHTVAMHEVAGMIQRWDTGEAVDAKVDRVLAAFFSHEWASENGWPPKHLAKYFGQIVAPQPKKTKQVSEFDAKEELRAVRKRLKQQRKEEQT